MTDPQIYRDSEMVLSFFMHKGWSESLPKMWRFTIYPLAVSCILDILSASADAYEVQENRTENINRVISNLRKIRTISRQLCEAHCISVKQMDYLDRIFCKIDTQAKKWRNAQKSKVRSNSIA